MAPTAADVHQVDVLDEVAHFVDKGLDVVEALHVQRRGAVQVDGARDPAHDEVLDVGGFAPQDGNHHVDFALILQGLEVMGHRQEVDLRGEFHGRVPPVAVGEDAQLPRGHDGLELVLDPLEFLIAVPGPGRQAVGQLRRLLGVGFEGRGDVHPVQGAQDVKMHDVVMNGVGRHHHVADVLGVQGHFDIQGVFD